MKDESKKVQSTSDDSLQKAEEKNNTNIKKEPENKKVADLRIDLNQQFRSFTNITKLIVNEREKN